MATSCLLNIYPPPPLSLSLSLSTFRTSPMDFSMYSNYALSLAATAILMLAFLHSFLQVSRQRLPPLLGSVLHQLLYFNTVHDYHTNLAAKSKTFRLLGPGRRFFYTADPAVVEHILRTNSANYGKNLTASMTRRDPYSQPE
ncbi:Cytochrome P450 [Canna indica]|uniref:Cytochrome P450 n=1 Tax=Canna indica TaxID=4628 RepID=A0AAQ3L260_9LILI|nr:Cytochrome P450 [Canna indica]